MSKKKKSIVLVASTEKSIAEIQLEFLSQVAQQRLLTLNETKQYDILVKNLQLLKEKEEGAIDGSFQSKSTEELLETVKTPEKIEFKEEDLTVLDEVLIEDDEEDEELN